MTDPRDYLKAKHRWPDLAARAVAITLIANPEETWTGKRQQRLHDWCSAMERDNNTMEAQCDFMDYELSNSLAALGAELNSASTQEEAVDTARKYLLVGNPARFLTQQEAMASGYRDMGNPELVQPGRPLNGATNKASNTNSSGGFEKAQKTAQESAQADKSSAGSTSEALENIGYYSGQHSQPTNLATNPGSKLG